MTIYNEPPPGMCIVPDKDDITKVLPYLLNSVFNVLHIELMMPQFSCVFRG